MLKKTFSLILMGFGFITLAFAQSALTSAQTKTVEITKRIEPSKAKPDGFY